MFQALTVPLNDSGFLILLPSSSYFCSDGKSKQQQHVLVSLLIINELCIYVRHTSFVILYTFVQILGPAQKSFFRESLCFQTHDSFAEVMRELHHTLLAWLALHGSLRFFFNIFLLRRPPKGCTPKSSCISRNLAGSTRTELL